MTTIIDPPAGMLSRQEAAERLDVSVRTIDRYIRRDHFDVQRSGRHVWISKESFAAYYQEQRGHRSLSLSKSGSDEPETIAIASRPDQATSDSTEAEPLSNRAFEAKFEPVEQQVPLSSHERAYQLSPTHIYKTLYEELRGKFDEQVTRLEGAHYRVGQLEAQVKTMVPQLEYNKQKKQLLLMDKQYKETVDEANRKLATTKKVIETERFNKNIYVVLVYGLLVLHVMFWALLQLR